MSELVEQMVDRRAKEWDGRDHDGASQDSFERAYSIGSLVFGNSIFDLATLIFDGGSISPYDRSEIVEELLDEGIEDPEGQIDCYLDAYDEIRNNSNSPAVG